MPSVSTTVSGVTAGWRRAISSASSQLVPPEEVYCVSCTFSAGSNVRSEMLLLLPTPPARVTAVALLENEITCTFEPVLDTPSMSAFAASATSSL